VKLTTRLHLSAEIRNEWSYTSTPPYAFMACTGTTLVLVKNFQCYFFLVMICSNLSM